jgi:hypothetical protein
MKADVILDRHNRVIRPRNRIESVLLPGAAWIDRHPTATLALVFACYLAACAI